jgi:hypothetical protein
LAVAAKAVEVLATVSLSWTAPEAVVEAAAMLITGIAPVVTLIGAVPVGEPLAARVMRP